MQLKKFTVVGVVITFYLSTTTWCLYVPEKKTNYGNKKNETSKNSLQIQICGNELTNLILEACDGIVGSLNQVNLSKGSAQTKITEDCCDHKCTLDYLQNYCGETPLFDTKKLFRGKLFDKLSSRSQETEVEKEKNKNSGKEKKEERSENERHNTINRSWPSIQVGTISPEIEKFGGRPTVVVKKNKFNTA